MTFIKTLTAAPWLAAVPCLAAAQPEDPDPLRWFTDAAGGRIELAYGEPGTDNIAITFFCRPGEGAAHAQTFAEGPDDDGRPMGSSWRTSFDLLSGEASRDYPARATQTETGPLIADARIPLDDPVIREFQRTGLLTTNHNPISADTEFEWVLIRAFFANCR